MRFLSLPQNEAQWHIWRRQGIGASEAAAILGLSPWVTPLQLWARKTGREPDEADNFAMSRGRRLESVIRQLYEARVGWTAQAICVGHDRLPWMRASLDGLDPWGEIIAEFKAPNHVAHAEALRGEVPVYYQPQVYHQLEVTGAVRCDYVSYTEHSDFTEDERLTIVPVEPNPAWQGVLVSLEQHFWECVEKDRAPDWTLEHVRILVERIATMLPATAIQLQDNPCRSKKKKPSARPSTPRS
jgi:putative phage-type endonuclease